MKVNVTTEAFFQNVTNGWSEFKENIALMDRPAMTW